MKVRYFDPNERPDLAHKFEIASKEGVVVVCDGPCETAKGTVKAVDVSEQSLTRAIRQAVSTKKKIYFLKGHGEAGPSDEKGPGASAVRGGLEDENVTVAELLLANEAAVPADADAVIVAGPDHALQDRELELLDQYLQKGGSVLVAADPTMNTNLEGQLAKWGVELAPEIVVEQQLQLFAGPQLGVQPVVQTYGAHPITEKLAGNPTVFRLARPVRKAPGSDVALVELATTSDKSWGETDTAGLLASKPVGLDPGVDKPGPLAIARRARVHSAGGQDARRAAGRGRRLRLHAQPLRDAVLQRRSVPEHRELAHRLGGVRDDRPQAPARGDGEHDARAVRRLPLPRALRAARGDPPARGRELVAPADLT